MEPAAPSCQPKLVVTEVFPKYQPGSAVVSLPLVGGARAIDGTAGWQRKLVMSLACVKQCNAAIEANRKEVRLSKGKGDHVSSRSHISFETWF